MALRDTEPETLDDVKKRHCAIHVIEALPSNDRDITVGGDGLIDRNPLRMCFPSTADCDTRTRLGTEVASTISTTKPV